MMPLRPESVGRFVLLGVLAVGLAWGQEGPPVILGGGAEPKPVTAPEAVEAGLGWLVRHQDAGGFWKAPQHRRGEHRVGVTGLAVLAFLGHGETHRAGPHRDVVRQALQWLKEQQDEEGSFGATRGPSHVYDHALAGLAMCEAYGMTKSAAWKEPARKAVEWTLRAQNPYKAWRYGVRPGENDSSVTSWMVMLLASARAAGLAVEPNALVWARDYLLEMTDPETGRTGYTRRGELPVRLEGMVREFPPEESESLTAMSLFARRLCGSDGVDEALMGKGLALLGKKLPTWDPARGTVDMMYWYFGTLATYQGGSEAFAAWNASLRKALLGSQRRVGEDRGSWDPVGPWGSEGGRVYSTALCTLSLEVGNRYEKMRRGR